MDRDVRFERLLEVVRWTTYDGRHPGMIGRAVAITGKVGRSVVRLDRTESNSWRVTPATDTDLDAAGVLRLVGEHGFIPQRVHLIPDLAELLFVEAVGRAEESVAKLRDVGPLVDQVRSNAKDITAWVLATSALDRCVRAGITAVMLAVAAAEAQANEWAATVPDWSGDDDKLGVPDKLAELAARRVGVRLPTGSGPLQQLRGVLDRRHRLTHPRPIEEDFPFVGDNALAPGRSVSLEGRRACKSVRESLVLTARTLDAELPHYLAYCPSAEPQDDAAWQAATLLTGAREDPDFPPIASAP